MKPETLLVRASVVLLVLALGGFGMWGLSSLKQAPEIAPPTFHRPLVRAERPTIGPARLDVRTQGAVVPRTESSLVPEVSGRVLSISPALANGGSFEQGEVLLTLDARDYAMSVAHGEQELARARMRLEQETADAARAEKDWNSSQRTGEPPPLVLREPQMAEARAGLAAAEAMLASAERDVERCELRAPFRGRVRSKEVDVGQYVTRGVPLAVLYAIDYAEVRLPLPDADLAFLDLPLRVGTGAGSSGPEVVLRARFAGEERTWSAEIVRTEGELDPLTRMVIAVARVEDPYGMSSDLDGVPLLVGMFVEAEVRGREVPNAIRLPRSALRGSDEVLVVGADGRLEVRKVQVLRAERDELLLEAGVGPEERVVVSPLETAVDGMEVRVQGDASEDAR